MNSYINFDFGRIKINRVVKHFILSDLMLWSGWGLIGPIFAVFIIQGIPNVSLVTIGATSAIYWIVKSIIQIPVALLLDRHKGEKDELYTLIGSLILAGFVALAFLLVKTTGQLYFVTLLQGIAFGLYIPSWYAIFSRHLDKDRYALDWSLDSTSIGVASGVTALIGGMVADYFGFPALFIAAGILSFGSAFVILTLPNIILPKRTTSRPLIADHLPSNVQK
ncbi:MAG: MFS transporter [Candidatus Jorgensenbacteria bacterium]|jgi:MFS family permease|nr:MFS transporter [Candidatus Jorgensenbacteria bacterium]